MIDDDLTPSESAILIVLMAEDREISNSELTKKYGLDVRKGSREKLIGLRYIASRQEKRLKPTGYYHVLDDKGWLRVQDDLNFDSPKARALGAALTILQTSLRDRVLPRVGFRSFAELFGRADIAPQPAASGLELRLRNAYSALATEPGAWVALSRLRPFFGDISREELDEALRRLSRQANAYIVPENNQKALTDADRAAALHIGGQDKHLLSIGE
jgi:hypothetical protein